MKAQLVTIPDFSKESYPVALYRRVSILFDPMPLTFIVPNGYHFLLYRANMKWAGHNPGIPGSWATPPKMTLVKSSGRRIFNVPCDLSLISSPADDGVAVDFTNPAFPHTATQLDRSKALPQLFYFGDTINIELSGFTIASNADPTLNTPSFVDVVLLGRYHPVNADIGRAS